jgi:hypothetical protein
VEVLGIRNGWGHVEVKLDGGRARVVEAASRMGGGYFGEMLELVYGIDRRRLLVDLHLGRLTVPPLVPRTTVVGRRVVADGLSWVAPSAAAWRRVFSDPRVVLVWPDSARESRRWVIGPPFGFKNTVVEYFAVHGDPDQAAAVAADVQRRLRILRIPIPATVATLAWRLAPLAARLRGRRWVDV